ncbi:cation/H(+) antiporter 15-like isoform X2 [Tasmannia lanceolata]
MVFSHRGNYMLQTVASIGFIYYLFLSGVKQDMSMIKQTGRRSFVIAISGWLLTLVSVGFSSFSLGKPVMKNTHKSFFATLAISLSITNFPVTHPILAELNLLNSEVGRLALSAAVITDFIAWTAFIFYQGNSQEGGIGHRKFMWYFISIILLICFIIFVIRPVMRWIVKQTPKGKLVDKVYIVPILLLAMVMAFFSNTLGATLAAGPLFMGMAVPDGPPLGATLVKNAETLNNSLFLSFFLTKAGLRVNLFKIASWKNWGIMQLIILSGYIGKLVGTVLACRCYRIPWKESLSLGLIMNFRGVVEIISYDHWLRDQLIDEQVFSTLMFSTVMVTGISSLLVSILMRNPRIFMAYDRRTIEHLKPHAELGILTCIHDEEDVPTIIKLLEASNSTKENPICVYVMHLVELVGRAAPMFIAHTSERRPSYPTEKYPIVNAFLSYEQHKGGNICIQPFTLVSPYKTMHEDICKLALDRKVSLIINPFHKQLTINGQMDATNLALQTVNPNILDKAPCSVGILVDRGRLSRVPFWAGPGQFSYKIAIIFLGGPDDREALAYASRMAQHPEVSLTVVRFLMEEEVEDPKRGWQADNYSVGEFRVKSTRNYGMIYRENVVRDGEEMVSLLRSMGGSYDLVMTGRKQESKLVLEVFSDWSECPELGVTGDFLASPDFMDGMVSVLVVQQQINMRTLVYKTE